METANWKRRFFTLWTGQQLSWIGSSVAGFALVWWLTKTTGSATVLAIATLGNVLPGVVLGPFVGALVDRWNRRLVLIVADGVTALFSAGLVYLFWSGRMQVWHTYAIMLARAICGAFHWPTMQASTSLMVPEKHLPRVAGLNQALGGAVNIVSPPLGALLLSVLPLHGIMMIDVVTAAFAIAPLFFFAIPQPQQATAASQPRTSLWADMREGLRYVWGWPGVLILCVTSMAINAVVNPAMSLLPILVVEHFGGGALQLGWMNSAWGIGLVVGGLGLSAWGGFRRRVVTMLVGIVGGGAGLLLIGLAPATAFLLALAGMFVGAALIALTNGAAFALLQQVVEPKMQGRVFTLIMSLCNGVTPLSLAVAGPVADALGVQTWFVVGAIVCIAGGIVGFATPAVMRLEDGRGRPAAVVEETLSPAPLSVAVE
jgi:DHA3 family macrolide efflux protein-like MFS transporter